MASKYLIIINGYKLRFYKTLKDDIQRWNCTKKKKNCKSYMKTDKSGNIILESHLNHNHEKDEHDIMVRQVIRNSVKRKG